MEVKEEEGEREPTGLYNRYIPLLNILDNPRLP